LAQLFLASGTSPEICISYQKEISMSSNLKFNNRPNYKNIYYLPSLLEISIGSKLLHYIIRYFFEKVTV
jgi:hypothetical protein